MELYNAAFLPAPDERVTGSVRIDWMDDGSALVMRQGDSVHPPSATWIIGRDESEPDYLVLYADDRGVSRLYRMSFAESNWRMWRDHPEFSQRYTAQMDPDGRTIRGRWEKSIDGGTTWEHDFNIDYFPDDASTAIL